MVTEPDELRRLANYAESHGAHTKANMLRDYADTIELYKPVVEAVAEEEGRGEWDRERVEQHIKENDRE